MRKAVVMLMAVAACLVLAPVQRANAQDTGTQATGQQSSQSQNHQPPAVLEIVRESVKEGHAAAHEKVESDWAAASRKHNFPNHVLALTSLTGPSEAIFLVGFSSFAEVADADQMFQKADIKAEMDTLDARDGEHRAASRTIYAVYRKDMSYRPELLNVAKTRYVGVLIFRPKLGRMQDFEEGSKKFLAADEKAGLKSPSIVYEVIGGVSGDMVIIFEPMESLKELDEFPARDKAVRDAMGDDFQQLMKSAGDVFTSIEYNLYAVNPRMSYVSKEMEDADPAFWRPATKATKAGTSKSTETGAE